MARTAETFEHKDPFQQEGESSTVDGDDTAVLAPAVPFSDSVSPSSSHPLRGLALSGGVCVVPCVDSGSRVCTDAGPSEGSSEGERLETNEQPDKVKWQGIWQFESENRAVGGCVQLE